MPRSGLSELVAARSEDLGVEYKAWMDTSPAEARAKIARHIAALANHGGGYLVFGVDDQTRLPMGETELDRRVFDQDTIAGIVQKYLDPRVQVRVEEAEHDGVGYPVLVVPSHEGRPVIAIADGPQNDKKQPVGIRQGEIYVRAAGPQSVPIRGADQWNGLLDRCLRHRADLLGQILRQSIARPSRPSPQAVDLLLAAVDATAADFTAQTEELAAEMQHPDQARMREIGRSFSVLRLFAAALVSGLGALPPRELVQRGRPADAQPLFVILDGVEEYASPELLTAGLPERGVALTVGLGSFARLTEVAESLAQDLWAGTDIHIADRAGLADHALRDALETDLSMSAGRQQIAMVPELLQADAAHLLLTFRDRRVITDRGTAPTAFHMIEYRPSSAGPPPPAQAESPSRGRFGLFGPRDVDPAPSQPILR